MAVDALYAADDFTGGAGALDDRTFSTDSTNFKWVKATPDMPWFDSLFLTGSGELTHTGNNGNADGYILSIAATNAPATLPRPFRIEMDVISAESCCSTISVGDYNYSVFNLNGQSLRLGARPRPITSGTSPGSGSFPSPPTPAYGAHTLSYEVSVAGMVTYKIDGTLLGNYSAYTPYDPAHLIISLSGYEGNGRISAVRVYTEGDETPPPDLEPLIYEERFNDGMSGIIYDSSISASCIGADTAVFARAPAPFDHSYITNRTPPSVYREAAAFEAPEAGSGDRFYVPFDDLQRPITSEDVCAQALVSVSSGADAVTFGWLDASDKTKVAVGVRLTVNNGFVVVETFYHDNGTRYSQIATLGGGTVNLTNLLPGDYWLRVVRRPWTGQHEISTDMSLRGGGATVGGIGGPTTDIYVNEPVVELSGDARLHYIYVGLDYPEFTVDAALLGDGRFWASLINASEEV